MAGGPAVSGARSRHREMWRLAGPSIVANLSIPLLGAVDTAVMGHLPEPYFLGAITIGALIFSYIYWGLGFLRMGTTAFAAQALGAGDFGEVGATLLRAVVTALGLGIAIILLRGFIGDMVFGLLEASSEVERHARVYYAIRVWAAPAALTNFAVLGWLFGMRRAGAALALQLFMNGLNIGLDLWFVLGLGWGVEGVALATVISAYAAGLVGVAMALRLLRRFDPPLANLGAWAGRALRAAPIKRLFAVNRDIFIRSFCLISAFAVFTAQSARLGDVTLAANAVLMTLQTFLSYGLDGFAHAAEALVGAAKGAGDRAALRGVVRLTTAWAAGTAVAYSLIYGLLGHELTAVMTNIPEVLEVISRYLPWLVASPLLSVWCFQLDGIFIGATRTGAMRNAMIVSLGVFLAAVAVLPPAIGNHGLWAALMLFFVVRALTLLPAYRRLEAALARPQM